MDNNEEPAVIVKDLHKSFKLPHEQHSGIKSLVVNFYKRKKGYEIQHVLNDINFEIKKGEFFGIVGRNGSGKSTLLKLLAGIYVPDKGLVHVNGSLTPFIELGVGFNPQLTGRENVFLNGALLGFSKSKMEEMYDDIVEFAELEKFMDQKLKNYSSGMQVRLAFSIAIRAQSDILLLDEVLAVGDANFQKKCFDYFHQLKKEKKTVILVSHNMDSVKTFCDRAMLIEKGNVVSIGDPDKVSDEYTLSNIDRSVKLNSKQPGQHLDRQVSIVSAGIFNDDGEQVYSVKSGRDLRIKIKYDIKDKIEDLNVGVGLVSSTYGYILGYNTKMENVAVNLNKNEVELTLESVPLLKGTYLINVVLFGKDEIAPYDLQREIIKFEVYDTGTPTSYKGILNIPHKWNV